ncbi:MAG TPA: MarR family winged helix-turn-helix transcriptional regulator [Candidatus Limnocylindrales bacterium]|jgi:DNA-binding MarR family transcriptional regulator|nr:MarR family winged helix-turn-helix transcriptional regulator [Candidatus Limnocylindrales bacterium]
MIKEKKSRPLLETEYMALAEFRYQLRRFLRHMEDEVRELGVNPQQYQVILAIKGLPSDQVPTISRIAERMQLNHNSTVELVDRCEERGLLKRARSGSDRRQVTLMITSDGDAMLRRLGSAARQELRSIGPMLVDSVIRLTNENTGKHAARAGTKRLAASKKAGT